jgi:predicted RNA binding protein YcfA (HicA-like mRNA interferase family)
MTLPRGVDARQLIKALGKLGYFKTRQTGCPIRLACESPMPHSLTVPDHAPLKAGTLNAILGDVATHHHIDKATLIDEIFGH